MGDAGRMKLSVVLGDYPNTLPIKAGEVGSAPGDFSFAEGNVANKGFKPLVREHTFDVGELAIVKCVILRGLTAKPERARAAEGAFPRVARRDRGVPDPSRRS